MKLTDRNALKNWEEFVADIANSTPVDISMSHADIEAHRIKLEKDPIQWIKYFFPKYAKYEFADFQVKAIRRIIKNPEWYEVLSWSRELAKSTIVMFIAMYLTMTGRKKNILLVSNTAANAIRLLAPYKANLEGNGRLKAYYGEQQTLGSWKEEEFITKKGVAFRGLGAGQPPRGSRNEAIRPDMILPDDFEDDDDVRNPDIITKRWDWFEKALYPTRSISEPTLILWCGNIIAKDCCITRAGAMADHWDVVNIRGKDGKSTWPQKNTEAHIDRVLSKMSTKAAQGEYFNNPISEGEVFMEMTFGKIPPLDKFRFLMIYGDPAPGENKKKGSSTKTVWLGGKCEGKLYVIKGFLDRGLNADFVNWFILLLQYVNWKVPVYCYMEDNSLQDPFFKQVFMPLVAKARKDKGINLNILPDNMKKTDKATRIEANLEPMNREGRLILNIDEKDNPHMKRLHEQFLLFTLRLKFAADGPDCIEGLNRMIDVKMQQISPAFSMSRSQMSGFNKNRV